MESKMFKCNVCGCDTPNDQSFVFRDGYRIEIHRCDTCQARFDLEFEWENKGETIHEDAIICPYCEHKYDNYDCYDFESGEHSEVECEICGKHFDLEVREVRQYSTKRSLCDMPEDFDPEEDDYD